MRLSKTKDSFQGRLDSNVHQSIMSRMVKERIWNKPSYHRRPKPGICTISINCLLIMIETTICTSQHKRKTSLCSKGSDNVKQYFKHEAHCFQNIQTLSPVSRTKKGTFPEKKNTVGFIFLSILNEFSFRGLCVVVVFGFDIACILVIRPSSRAKFLQKIPRFPRNSRKIPSR